MGAAELCHATVPDLVSRCGARRLVTRSRSLAFAAWRNPPFSVLAYLEDDVVMGSEGLIAEAHERHRRSPELGIEGCHVLRADRVGDVVEESVGRSGDEEARDCEALLIDRR